MSRHAPLTVISGAPGTGKSHTVISIVCDALRRGESVLVAARNDAAVDALLDLIARQPGLTPVVFGSSDRRAQLTQRLSDGAQVPVRVGEIRAAHDRLVGAAHARDQAMDAARSTLHDEWLRTPDGAAARADAVRIVPRCAAARVAGLDAVIEAGTREPAGSWAHRRRRSAQRRLRRLVGAPAEATVDEIVSAVHAVQWSPVELTTTAAVEALDREEAQVHARLTSWLALEVRSEQRLDQAGLAAVATVATALRSGRGARRVQLARLKDRALTRALPVWVGTLGDVDDLLPSIPALFDLVLIDEASGTEQTAATAALLRARRAVVVGDPRQLRHVSFVADETINRELDHRDVEPSQRSQLDVRRNSLFDAAAAASPVVVLDEHFRSAPQLIEVVAASLYSGHLAVATRTTVSQSIRCVHVEQVDGIREHGVIQAEVDAVVAALRRLSPISRSVGVISPFRAQAEALDAAILAAFRSDDLVRMNLRVGTVHSFQGNERDTVLCSLGLNDGDPGGWSFIAESHLLAVMLTRARLAMTIFASCHPNPSSVLGKYIAAADTPPGCPPPARPLGPWARSVVDELRRVGLDVAEAYPSGRHVVDAALVADHRPLAVICDLHPDGVDAHIRRHLDLQRAGWSTFDALPSRWEDSTAALTLEIVRLVRPTPER